MWHIDMKLCCPITRWSMLSTSSTRQRSAHAVCGQLSTTMYSSVISSSRRSCAQRQPTCMICSTRRMSPLHRYSISMLRDVAFDDQLTSQNHGMMLSAVPPNVWRGPWREPIDRPSPTSHVLRGGDSLPSSGCYSIRRPETTGRTLLLAVLMTHEPCGQRSTNCVVHRLHPKSNTLRLTSHHTLWGR